jgi:hypothetical protein
MRDMTSELEAEVDFWRKLISEWQLDETLPEYRRLRDALALAEFKLGRLREQDFPDHGTLQ